MVAPSAGPTRELVPIRLQQARYALFTPIERVLIPAGCGHVFALAEAFRIWTGCSSITAAVMCDQAGLDLAPNAKPQPIKPSRGLIDVKQHIPRHLVAIVNRVFAAPISAPPPPWTGVTSAGVGGLMAVGYARDTDLLLVTSSQGQGVFDCLTGERVARNPNTEFWEDTGNLETAGIGPLAGQLIRMSGIFGGGLSVVTADGWQVERLVLQWPAESLLLVPPGASIFGDLYNQPAQFHKISVESEVRAWGFSPTGNSLVLATSSEVTIYRR